MLEGISYVESQMLTAAIVRDVEDQEIRSTNQSLDAETDDAYSHQFSSDRRCVRRNGNVQKSKVMLAAIYY